MIDVAFTRLELRSVKVAVVIDVLRATSTVTQALASGYPSVVCVDSVERAIGLRAPGRVLAGEQHCLMPPGFDQGNSPRDAATCRGDELVLATTNGAPTIVAAAARARHVLLASLLNLDAVLHTLRASVDVELQIVCAGTDGAAALEDTYLAGRICAELPGPRTDAALIAEAVARRYATPWPALAASADARVLRASGLAADIDDCALESQLELVPHVLRTSNGMATVGLGRPPRVLSGARREPVRPPHGARTR